METALSQMNKWDVMGRRLPLLYHVGLCILMPCFTWFAFLRYLHNVQYTVERYGPSMAPWKTRVIDRADNEETHGTLM